MSIVRPTICASGIVALILSSIVGAAVAQDTIGYGSVAEARLAVSQLPGAAASEQSGWLIVEVRATQTAQTTQTMWSFTPERHEAYPAVVKRTIVQSEGYLSVEMDVLCEGHPPACDRLVDRFKAVNERMMRGSGGTR